MVNDLKTGSLHNIHYRNSISNRMFTFAMMMFSGDFEMNKVNYENVYTKKNGDVGRQIDKIIIKKGSYTTSRLSVLTV